MAAPRLGHRGHPAWAAYLLHRLSGLALALFLPLHFLALGLALDQAAFDVFLDWTRSPWLRASEIALALALLLHLLGGARLLWRELRPW